MPDFEGHPIGCVGDKKKQDAGGQAGRSSSPQGTHPKPTLTFEQPASAQPTKEDRGHQAAIDTDHDLEFIACQELIADQHGHDGNENSQASVPQGQPCQQCQAGNRREIRPRNAQQSQQNPDHYEGPCDSDVTQP